MADADYRCRAVAVDAGGLPAGIRLRLRRLRRCGLRLCQSTHSIGNKPRVTDLGIYDGTRKQLASLDVAVTRAGLPGLRAETRRPASDERPDSYHEHPVAVLRFAEYHRHDLAQRVCGRAVCVASNPCGIRRMDFRAQRRPERLLLAAHHAGLCALHATAQKPKLEIENLLRVVATLFRFGFDEQADGGDAAIRAAVAGLLAAAPDLRIN